MLRKTLKTFKEIRNKGIQLNLYKIDCHSVHFTTIEVHLLVTKKKIKKKKKKKEQYIHFSRITPLRIWSEKLFFLVVGNKLKFAKNKQFNCKFANIQVKIKGVISKLHAIFGVCFSFCSVSSKFYMYNYVIIFDTFCGSSITIGQWRSIKR